jgi:hypothetical protein
MKFDRKFPPELAAKLKQPAATITVTAEAL